MTLDLQNTQPRLTTADIITVPNLMDINVSQGLDTKLDQILRQIGIMTYLQPMQARQYELDLMENLQLDADNNIPVFHEHSKIYLEAINNNSLKYMIINNIGNTNTISEGTLNTTVIVPLTSRWLKEYTVEILEKLSNYVTIPDSRVKKYIDDRAFSGFLNGRSKLATGKIYRAFYFKLEFNSNSQRAVDGLYTIKYLTYKANEAINSNWQDDAIHRTRHGVAHAARCTVYVDILHNLKKQLLTNDGEIDPFAMNAINFLAERFMINIIDVVTLTKIAMFFHDSARETEDVDYWDHRSAENCYEYFIHININEDIARFFSNAIKYKDQATEFKNFCATISVLQMENKEIQLAYCDYIRELIHYADMLDIMRVRSTFYGFNLDEFFRVSNNQKNFTMTNLLLISIRNFLACFSKTLPKTILLRSKNNRYISLEFAKTEVVDNLANILTEMEYSEAPYQHVLNQINSNSNCDFLRSLLNPNIIINEEYLIEQKKQLQYIPPPNVNSFITRRINNSILPGIQLIKHISKDKWKLFVHNLFNVNTQNVELRRKKTAHEQFKLTANGVASISAGYTPQYNQQQKHSFTKKQSMTLISTNNEYCLPSHGDGSLGVIFFSNKTLNEAMTDEHFLISLLMKYDASRITYSRSFYFSNQSEAEFAYHNLTTNNAWFPSVEALINYAISHDNLMINEVLARLKWTTPQENIFQKCQIGIFQKHDLKIRLTAQMMALDIQNRIKSIIPISISFYDFAPASLEHQYICPYTLEQQQQDIKCAVVENQANEDTKILGLILTLFKNNCTSASIDEGFKTKIQAFISKKDEYMTEETAQQCRLRFQ